MDNVLVEIRKKIEEKWYITGETSNRIYFKYSLDRGTPKFYFNKLTMDVVRDDKLKDSSRAEMSTVEVRTTIYSLLDDAITPVDAQELFNKRNEPYYKDLLSKYGGRGEQTGGVAK